MEFLMAQPAAPVAGQPPAQPAAAQQAGLLNDREVNQLQSACCKLDGEKGQVIGTLIGVATLITGIWACVIVGGFQGFLLACAIIIVGGNVLGNIYNRLRNHDYSDAGNALGTPSFRSFLQRNNLDLSIDSIVLNHKNYKAHLAQQAKNVQPAHA